MKRDLLAANESGRSITQIAITDLKAVEIAGAHVHQDMQEGFYVLSSELDIVLDGVVEIVRQKISCGSSAAQVMS